MSKKITIHLKFHPASGFSDDQNARLAVAANLGSFLEEAAKRSANHPTIYLNVDPAPGAKPDSDFVVYFIDDRRNSIAHRIAKDDSADSSDTGGLTVWSSRGCVSEVWCDKWARDTWRMRGMALTALHEISHNKLDAKPHGLVKDMHLIPGVSVLASKGPSNLSISDVDYKWIGKALSVSRKQYTEDL